MESDLPFAMCERHPSPMSGTTLLCKRAELPLRSSQTVYVLCVPWSGSVSSIFLLILQTVNAQSAGSQVSVDVRDNALHHQKRPDGEKYIFLSPRRKKMSKVSILWLHCV